MSQTGRIGWSRSKENCRAIRDWSIRDSDLWPWLHVHRLIQKTPLGINFVELVDDEHVHGTREFVGLTIVVRSLAPLVSKPGPSFRLQKQSSSSETCVKKVFMRTNTRIMPLFEMWWFVPSSIALRQPRQLRFYFLWDVEGLLFSLGMPYLANSYSRSYTRRLPGSGLLPLLFCFILMLVMYV